MYGMPGLGGAFWKPEEAQAYAKAHGFDDFQRIDTGVGPYGKYNQSAVNAALIAKMKEQGVDPANAGLLAFSAGGYAANKLPQELRSQLGHVAVIGSPGVNENAFGGSQKVFVNPKHDLGVLQNYLPQQTNVQPAAPQVEYPTSLAPFDVAKMGQMPTGQSPQPASGFGEQVDQKLGQGLQFLSTLARNPQAKLDMLHPEFVNRFAKAAKAAYAATGEYPRLPYASSAGRTREDQADIWRRSQGGRLFAAASPGRSNHEANYQGQSAAVDLEANKAREWIRQNVNKFGLRHLGDYDRPHFELDRNWRGQ
jgi:hypothetical protein